MRGTVIFLTAFFSASIAASSSSSSSSVAAQQSEEPKKIANPIRSEGCGLENATPLAKPGGTSTRIKLGDRYFRLTLPVNYAADKPAPLIIAFHDHDSSAKKLEKATLLSHPNYNKDAVVAYPEAAIETRWMSDPERPHGIDDISFTSSLIGRLSSKLCIDQDRIFATGQGTGGGMAHLLACSPITSKTIAAFALVNANILLGQQVFLGPHNVKDPTQMLWEKCRPARIGPMRLMSIHTENNTVYDYWGDEKFKDHKRIGAVRWLVDWAHENKCGMALEMPSTWRGQWDKVFKTRLHQGYIFEGFVENGTVTKAMYHCWFGDTGEDVIPVDPPEEAPEALPEGEKSRTSSKWKVDRSTQTDSSEKSKNTGIPIYGSEASPILDPDEDTAEFIRKLRESAILEHYFLRNYGHGWPRVKRSSLTQDTTENEADSKKPAGYEWEDVTEPPEKELNLSFNDETAFTFHYGFGNPDPKEVTFDSTARVLDFFRMFRLSDPPPKAPRDEQGLTEVESDVLGKLVLDIQKKLDESKAEEDAIAAEKDEL